MARYNYTIHNKGVRQTGTIEAESEDAALGRLKAGGVTVLDLRVREQGGRSGKERSVLVRFGLGCGWLMVRQRSLELFLRQLGSLLRAGVPILTALAAVSRTCPRGLARALERATRTVREGRSLSKAMEQELPASGRVTLGLIGVGEANGTLDTMCCYAAELKEYGRNLRGQMLQTFSYPAIVLLGAFGVGYFMVRYVFPTVMEFIEGSGRRAGALPLPTRMVIAMDAFLSIYGMYMLMAPVVLALAIIVLRGSARSGEMVDAMALKIPLLGGAFRFHANTVWCRTMGSMLVSGLDIMAAVDLTRSALGNWYYAAQLRRIKDSVREGKSLGYSIGATELRKLCPLAYTMICVSEEGGSLEESFAEAAKFSEEQLQRRVALLGKLVEPTVFLIVGGIVGLVYFGFFMAVLSATQQVF